MQYEVSLKSMLMSKRLFSMVLGQKVIIAPDQTLILLWKGKILI